MNKTIIGVWNNENTGKSGSILEAYKILLAKRAKIDYSITGIASYSNPDVNNNEVVAVLDYKGIKIGIESQGDPTGRQFNTLPDLVQHHCDIIICASRCGGKTCTLIDTTIRSGYDLIWYSNFYFDDKNNTQGRHISLNHFNGECIVKLVDDLFSGKI